VANNTTDYKRKFNAENYDRMEITVPKGKKAEIKEFAKSLEKSVNLFVNEAIDEKMQRDQPKEGE